MVRRSLRSGPVAPSGLAELVTARSTRGELKLERLLGERGNHGAAFHRVAAPAQVAVRTREKATTRAAHPACQCRTRMRVTLELRRWGSPEACAPRSEPAAGAKDARPALRSRASTCRPPRPILCFGCR